MTSRDHKQIENLVEHRRYTSTAFQFGSVSVAPVRANSSGAEKMGQRKPATGFHALGDPRVSLSGTNPCWDCLLKTGTPLLTATATKRRPRASQVPRSAGSRDLIVPQPSCAPDSRRWYFFGSCSQENDQPQRRFPSTRATAVQRVISLAVEFLCDVHRSILYLWFRDVREGVFVVV